MRQVFKRLCSRKSSAYGPKSTKSKGKQKNTPVNPVSSPPLQSPILDDNVSGKPSQKKDASTPSADTRSLTKSPGTSSKPLERQRQVSAIIPIANPAGDLDPDGNHSNSTISKGKQKVPAVDPVSSHPSRSPNDNLSGKPSKKKDASTPSADSRSLTGSPDTISDSPEPPERQQHLNATVPNPVGNLSTTSTDLNGSQSAIPKVQKGNTRPENLWKRAYETLPDESKKCFQDLKVDFNSVSGKGESVEKVLEAAKQAQQKLEGKKWIWKFGNREIDISQKGEAIITWIKKFKDVGDVVVQFDSHHAALPWAGVRFMLVMMIGNQENMAAAVYGTERIAFIISRCAIYEHLYLFSEVVPAAAKATENLRQSLVDLYATVLSALGRFIEFFQSRRERMKASVLNPGALVEKIRELDAPESAVNIAVGAVENCYHGITRRQNQKEFDALKEILKEFESVVLSMGTTLTAMFKKIEEKERIKILKWLSDIPYRSHHDFAQEGRVQDTGHWLFERQEFQGWWKAKESQILWVHGIPGAGKTKLMSAAIDYLMAIPKKPEVAFFYCKRDEGPRRNRHQILLTLLKQLACPDTETIYVQVLDAYNEEQKDPSSRKELSMKAVNDLLMKLLGCHQVPVIILDALDECSKDTRSDLIGDLLSFVKNLSCTVKILVSSRLSLDIEDSLQNSPHVRIEARDNAEDIKRYVETELDSRIKSRKLLRGDVEPSLKQHIQEVLLRDANGMFLWVDYQLRELCNSNYDDEVRDRLGKLPKTLNGVYNEIMERVNRQTGRSLTQAQFALKWVLASETPLGSKLLTDLVNIDPSTSLSNLSTPLKKAVRKEILISSCGGLIVWDQEVDVIRFAHLSVREYLEEQHDNWTGMLEAQRNVAEACLWILLTPHSIDPNIYEHAAEHWISHCRSYQELAIISQKNLSEGILTLLLKRFLGSFDKPSTEFARLVNWQKNNDLSIIYPDSKIWLGSTPLRPAFAAALGGLGRLVDWLWLSKDIDMNIHDDKGMSLLNSAVYLVGDKWIIEKILDWGVDINTVDKHLIHTNHGTTALQNAAFLGKLEVISLVLDRGADVNLVGGVFGTALGAAAYSGSLEVVMLLLDRGADVNLVGGHFGTALGAAAYRGSLEIVMILLDRGADVNLVGGIFGTALGAAAFWGRLEIVSLLLNRGANIDLLGGKYGTALGAAAYEGNLDVVSLLLDRGANVNLVSGNYGTALGAAAFWGRLEIVWLLLNRGANIDLLGGKYGTALGAAACEGNLDVVSLLLDRGANVNLVSGNYGTALGCAAAAREWLDIVMREKVVSLLLDRGANVNLVAGEYGTALGVAAYQGKLEIVSLLLDRGADPHHVLEQINNATLPRWLDPEKRELTTELVELLKSKLVGGCSEGPSGS